jgi:hypothetical protein
MIQNGVTMDHTVPHRLYQKSIQTIQNHLILRGSQTALNHELDIMIVVHIAMFSTQYPQIAISPLAKRLENLLFPFFTLPLLYGPQIATHRHKGFILEYVMLCYDFITKSPACSAKDSPTQAPLAPCGSQVASYAIPT